MSRKFKLFSSFLVLGLVLALVSIVPAFSAVAGTATILDEEGGSAKQWATIDKPVWVQVTDKDLDVPLKKVILPSEDPVTDCPSGSVCDDAFAHTLLATTDIQTIVLDAFPILDSNVGAGIAKRFTGAADTVLNKLDVLITDTAGAAVTNLDVISISAADGVVYAKFSTAPADPVDVVVMYWAADATDIGIQELPWDDSVVYLTSNAEDQGMGVVLTETGPSTGVFGAYVKFVDSDLEDSVETAAGTLGDPYLLQVFITGDTVRLIYKDPDPVRTVTKSIVIETAVPAFANFSPDDGFATNITRPTFSGSVTDADSGVKQVTDDETIFFVFRVVDEDDVQLIAGDTVDPSEIGAVSAITGGFSAQARLPSTFVAAEDVYIIQWWMIAEDVAGNRGVSTSEDLEDCDSSLFDVDTGGTEFSGCEPYTVRVDFAVPVLSSATTGNWVDTSVSPAVRKSGASGKNTFVEVIFDEALDSTTVAPTDFTVSGTSVVSAAWYSEFPASVFLTTNAIASDAKPTVSLTGQVKDKAGNGTAIGSVTAGDGIPAALTVTVTGTASSRPVTDKTITIRVTSDEALTTTPAVQIKSVAGADWTITGAAESVTIRLVATRTWEVVKDLTTASLYNVYVSGTDLGGSNLSKKGVESGSVKDKTSAILFEVDTGIPDPEFSPADEGETDDPNAFLIVDFAGEGTEYVGDSHGKVTLVSATLDDVGVTLNTRDNVVFLVRPGSLALGDHTLELTVEDSAGNEDTFSATFSVTERAAYELPLDPGLNLVSFPGTPETTGLNALLGTLTDIDLVITYDPINPAGPWLIAQRDATTGNFTGNLTAIDAYHAYWIRTNTFVDVPAFLSKQTYDKLPPTIPVVKGWNMVPVIDVALSTAGTAKPATAYFLNIGWSIAWTFDTLTSTWTRIIPGDNLVIGKGYWVFATASGTIVP